MAKLLLALKCPKLGVQLPNAGDDNQSCRILTVIFNRIEQLRIPKYNLYSSTFFYTNVSISTALWCSVFCVLFVLCFHQQGDVHITKRLFKSALDGLLMAYPLLNPPTKVHFGRHLRGFKRGPDVRHS